MNYQVSDFIIRIKNAGLAKRRDVVLPYSKMNKEIGKILVREKFLEDLKEETVKGKKELIAKIKYENRNPVLTDIKVVSKPSLRIYINSKIIPSIERKGRVTSVLSTNKGILTGREAIKKGVGGELLFKVW